MRSVLILLAFILLPFAATAGTLPQECVQAEEMRPQGDINEVFGTWPPGIEQLLQVGCVPEKQLLGTDDLTPIDKLSCVDSWHIARYQIGELEGPVLARIYKGEKAIAGMFSPNPDSMSPIYYFYLFVSDELVKPVQDFTFKAKMEEFDPLPANCFW